MQVNFFIRYIKRTVNVSLPVTASVGDIKSHLKEQTQVPICKQRLLFNAPVIKSRRHDAPDDLKLAECFSGETLQQAETKGIAIKVNVMLLGSAEAVPQVDCKATSELSRLVASTIEQDGRWLRCSYIKGYLRQTAYVCRTCVDEGKADPAHSICLACAELCHSRHEVEEWGVRYHMRCDCCTVKCWKQPGRESTGNQHQSPAVQALSLSDASSSLTTSVVTNADVSKRTNRKRSRSSSPLTTKRPGGGSSPSGGGVRVAVVSNGPSPFSLPNPPDGEMDAVALSIISTRMDGNCAELLKVDGVPIDNDAVEPENATRDEPEPTRCRFILDCDTGKPPERVVLPTNRHNRYPRNPVSWCYCEDDNPIDDPECCGIACMLCTTSFWSVHMTRLFTEQYRRVPCYGDVVQGASLAFRCDTCDTYVCAPCRLRCHKDHEVCEEFVIPSKESKTDNGAPEGVNFSCGCRGFCSIAETVPDEDIDDNSKYMPPSPQVAIEIMNSDVFMGLVCAHCMQRHPWLMTDNPLKCYNGHLPEPVTKGILPIVPCADTRTTEELPTDVFPYHGMLLPVNAFTEEMTCSCPPCRAAFRAFAPRATDDAPEMIVELHDNCDNCDRTIKDQQAYMCQTCEMTHGKSFFICKDCNSLRESLGGHCCVTQPHTAEGDDLRPSTASDVAAIGSPADRVSGAEEKRNYRHELSHIFLEDTYENLYALCGMQAMQSLDTEGQEYVMNNWDSLQSKFSITNTLSDSFGQVSLTFDEEDLNDVTKLNSASMGRTQDEQSDHGEK